MEAAARGAKREGGLSVGILPGTSRSDGNPFLDVAIPTGIGEMRNVIVVRAADGVLAVGGGFGTLSEIAMAAKLGKPVMTLKSWKLAAEGQPWGIPSVDSVEEAVDALMGLISNRASRP